MSNISDLSSCGSAPQRPAKQHEHEPVTKPTEQAKQHEPAIKPISTPSEQQIVIIGYRLLKIE